MAGNRTREITPLEKSFKKEAERIERQAYTVPTSDFEDNSESAREKRVKKAMRNFEYFDRTYFPPEFHSQGYYKPGVLHHSLLEKSLQSGAFWFGTHRDLAKSAYLKKIRIWHFLSGRASIGGILSETLKKSQKFVRGIATILMENKRLRRDFDIKITVMNEDMLQFSTSSNKRYCHYVPYSLDSNPRGDNIHIERPDFIDFDDIETHKNKFSEENTDKKLKKITEAFRSTKENGNMIGIGNNLHPKCLFNRLKQKQEKGEESHMLKVFPFPAWSDEITEFTPYQGSVWHHKYPAESQNEMRKLMKIHDDVEWSEAMCEPVLKSGRIFPREFAKYYSADELPNDAVGLAYCDPNLSLKEMGDTTAFGALLYSRSKDEFFVYKPRCRSYDNPNQLLKDYFSIMDNRVRLFGMDGQVSQEAVWKNNIRNFSRITGIPTPAVIFCRYNVDQMVDHFESVYKLGKVHFPKEFAETEEGEEFMNQMFTFVSKKENKKDDAPDFLVSCYALALEKGIFIANTAGGGSPFEVTSVGFGGGW